MHKGTLRAYLAKTTGFSRAQITRLTAQYLTHGNIRDQRGPQPNRLPGATRRPMSNCSSRSIPCTTPCQARQPASSANALCTCSATSEEWKSHANLRAFSTAKPAIVEGLTWAAIVVAAVKRYLAHSVQIVAEVATSTLRAARCA